MASYIKPMTQDEVARKYGIDISRSGSQKYADQFYAPQKQALAGERTLGKNTREQNVSSVQTAGMQGLTDIGVQQAQAGQTFSGATFAAQGQLGTELAGEVAAEDTTLTNLLADITNKENEIIANSKKMADDRYNENMGIVNQYINQDVSIQSANKQLEMQEKQMKSQEKIARDQMAAAERQSQAQINASFNSSAYKQAQTEAMIDSILREYMKTSKSGNNNQPTFGYYGPGR